MIARRLRKARARLGWSRETLAHHSGVSWSAIAQIESRRRKNARPATLGALARALGITVDYLIGENSPPSMLAHRAVVYGSDEECSAATLPFIKEGLEHEEAVIAVARAPQVALLKDALGTDAKGVTFARSEDWYASPLEAARAYSSFVDNRLEKGYDWIRIMGEIVFAKQDRDEVGPWTSYESAFNVMFTGRPVSALCLYDALSSTQPVLDMVMETHPHLGVGGEAAPNEKYVDPEQILLGGEGS